MDDSWGRFWERLITHGVAVLVIGFALQGLWFAGGAALTSWRPDLATAAQKTSERFLAVWLVAMVLALGYGVKTAWAGKDE